MDVWVFAAAAGAGYVAQQLKNLSNAKQIWCDLSSESLNLLKLTQKAGVCFGQDLCGQRKLAGHDAYASELSSTCGCKDGSRVMEEEFMRQGVDSSSDSLPGLLGGKDIHGNSEHEVSSDSDRAVTGVSMLQSSSSEIGCSYGLRWCKSNLRSGLIENKYVKPRTSLESCLMAQLYKEHVGFEEYICSVCLLRKPRLKPSHVRDECRIVSDSPHEIFNKASEVAQYELSKDYHSLENNSVVGIPRLLDSVPVELQKNNAKTGKEQDFLSKRNSELVIENQGNAQDGVSDGALPLYLGLTIGIICSFLRNKKEIQKLRKSLMQSENLVQDLQEELEMKDALTVKELAVEDYELLDVPNGPCFDSAQVLPIEAKLDDSSRYCTDRGGKHIADEESLRKIEAELEAELNMLESNINSARFEGQLSNIAELDPSFISDVMEGDLRADLFGVKVGTQGYADRDGSNNSTPHTAQYPVSPRELSLHLHEVVQSRLKERIKELETALQHSQCKIKRLEYYNPCSLRDFPNYEMGSASNDKSPTARDRLQSPDEPVIINLSSEEAAAPYNDTYDEFTWPLKYDEEEERKPQEIIHLCSKDPDSYQNGHAGQGSICNGSQEMVINPYEGMYSSSSSSRDESEDEDEMEKLLIRQIVEKARQGSPAVLKARALLATDLN